MKIIFAGTPKFALPSLQAIYNTGSYQIIAVYTQADRPQGRGRRIAMSPVKQFALEKNIPVCQPLTLRDASEQEKLAHWQPDLIVVAAYGLILPKAVLAIPPLSCINVHASLLPRWRGAAPIQRAILAGDQVTGISIMQMEPGLDTGPVLLKAECKIESKDTGHSLEIRLADLGAKTLLTSLKAIQTGNYILQRQDNRLSTYAKKIEKEEAEIDWFQSAELLARQIRAFMPRPGAFTFINHQQLLKIGAAEVAEIDSEKKLTAPPGTILNVSSTGIEILTGKGVLRLLQLQFAGGRLLPVKSLMHAKSHLFQIGSVLGRAYA